MVHGGPEEGTGRVALVTGGTRGIGAAIAGALRSSGHDVFVAARSPDGADPARTISGDLAVPGAAARAVEEVLDRAGRLDVLVNNAGMQHVARIDTFPRETWDRMLALHLSAPFEATAAALPPMRENGFGRIVNMSSVHGLIASAGKAPYTATKHGLVGLTKAVALETAADGITCNAICPGFVRTTLIEEQIDTLARESGLAHDAAAKAMLAARQPTGRMIQPDAVAAMVVWLCSDAARDVTGAALPIDGGWSAR